MGKKDHDRFIINLQIENKSIQMGLDAGAALSSISLSDNKQSNNMFKTGVQMKTNTREIIALFGVCFVQCKVRDHNFHNNW